MDQIRLEQRIAALEREVMRLKKHLNLEIPDQETAIKRNDVAPHMIKLVYPGIFTEVPLTAGYPKNRRTLAARHQIGQEMAMYVTSPHKVIVGVARVIGECAVEQSSQWPYQVPIQWTIGPKPGITLKEAGLDIRPRVGDTVFSITEDDMNRIKEMLSRQSDLDAATRSLLSQRGR